MDVFISYRRSASIFAESIRSLLSERNVEVFLDKHEIKNQDFLEMLDWNIDECPNFLLILSKDSFRDNKTDGIDYYRYEIEQAIKKNKNLIVVKVGDFNENDVAWNKENEIIKKLKTFNNISFGIGEQRIEIDNILSFMKDEKGATWKYLPKDNSNWYATHKISEKDTVWMDKNYRVCDKMDANLLKEMLNSPEWEESMSSKDHINYFCLNLYDPWALERKINFKNDLGIRIDAYGFCHNMLNLDGKNTLEDCDERFGKNHFLDYCEESKYKEGLDKLLELNHIEYFDVIECTLCLKDCENPARELSLLKSYLNPNGGFIFIRELDDDLVSFYPDNNGYVGELMKLLKKNAASGNRHLGKQLQYLFKTSGAKETYISDEVVSTANCYDDFEKEDICDAYFSYLETEFLSSSNEHPHNDKYRKCYEYVRDNYQNVLDLFRRDDFYFRAGFISGYGFYKQRRRR